MLCLGHPPGSPHSAIFVVHRLFDFFIISFTFEYRAGQPAHADADVLLYLMGFSGCNWLRLFKCSSAYGTANACARVRQH